VLSESYDPAITFTPTHTRIIQNNDRLNLIVYKNPSSKLSPVTISFDVYNPGEVEILIYEITGRLVFFKEINYTIPGNKNVKWDGKENSGFSAENGIYIVKVLTENLNATRKIIRLD